MSQHSDNDGFVITFPVKWSAFAGVVIIALTVAYHFLVGQQWKDTVVFLAAATAAGGTVMAAAYNARTLNLFLRQETMLRERESALDTLGKKERSMKFAQRWNDPRMYHVRNTFRCLLEKRTEPTDELIKHIQQEKTNVTHIINFIEEIAFARDHDLVDEELVRNQFEGIVVTLWSTVRPWVEAHRNERGRPKIWRKTEELFNTWQ